MALVADIWQHKLIELPFLRSRKKRKEEKMEQKTLYLECYSGISGDMMVGALLDLGANEEVLKAALDSLPISGWQIKTSRVKKAGIDACDFQVNLVYDNHDHNMEYRASRC